MPRAVVPSGGTMTAAGHTDPDQGAVGVAVSVATPMRVYGAALRRAVAGQRAILDVVTAVGAQVGRIDAAQWTVELRRGDASIVDRCGGATLDVGCGPGRLAAAVQRRGHPVLGVDISAEAVRQARRRGVPAVRGDVFAPLPIEGRWRSILLADGNIGIGGDPGRLLHRCAGLLDRRGTVVVEVRPPGERSWAGHVALHDGARRSHLFPWACVAAPDVAGLVRGTALRIAEEWTEADRWFVRLVR